MNPKLPSGDEHNALANDGLAIGHFLVPCIALLLLAEGLSHLGSGSAVRVALPLLSSAIVAGVAYAIWKYPERLQPFVLWTLIPWLASLINVWAHIDSAPVLALVFATMILLLVGSLITPITAILIALPVTAAVQIASALEIRAELPGALLVPAFSIPLAVLSYWGRRRITLEQTRRRQLDIRVQQQQTELDRLDTLSRVSGQVAHHINNKLVGVVAGTSTAMALLEDDHPARRWLEIANDSAESVATISKKLTGHAHETFAATADTPITQLLDPAYLKARIPSTADLSIDIDDDLIVINGNPEQLREAIASLVENASETLPEGGIISLHASTDQTSGAAIVRVSDNGEGIETEVLKRVAEPFFTTRGPSRLGLGLSFASEAMRKQGGTLQIQSTAGKGTTVTLRFAPHPLSAVRRATAGHKPL